MSLKEINTKLLAKALTHLNQAFAGLPEHRPLDQPDPTDSIDQVMLGVAERLQENFPFHHPNYAGHMVKPPHPVAQLAYVLAQSINPNNHALDGGRASSEMEKEAVAHIAEMVGWGESHLGHLCSGGTIANLEALWVARELQGPDAVVVSSDSATTPMLDCPGCWALNITRLQQTSWGGWISGSCSAHSTR